MLIYNFLSITLLKGGKFSINSAKRCLVFRLIELQPGECLFSILGGKFFLSSYALRVCREPSIAVSSRPTKAWLP